MATISERQTKTTCWPDYPGHLPAFDRGGTDSPVETRRADPVHPRLFLWLLTEFADRSTLGGRGIHRRKSSPVKTYVNPSEQPVQQVLVSVRKGQQPILA